MSGNDESHRVIFYQSPKDKMHFDQEMLIDELRDKRLEQFEIVGRSVALHRIGVGAGHDGP